MYCLGSLRAKPLSPNLLAIEGCARAGSLIQDNLGLYIFQMRLLLRSNLLVSNQLVSNQLPFYIYSLYL